jgi:hypothetical protein
MLTLSDIKPIRYQTYPTQNLSDNISIRYWTYQIPHLSDNEIIGYQTYHIPKLSVTKPIIYRNYQIPNLSGTEPIRYHIYQILNRSVLKTFSVLHHCQCWPCQISRQSDTLSVARTATENVRVLNFLENDESGGDDSVWAGGWGSYMRLKLMRIR